MMPRLEYIKLPGERNETPMFCKLCFHEAILVCAKKSKVADAQIRIALDIYSRHIVGDRRLREENEANEDAAPRQARVFVLGAEEADRQLRQLRSVKTKLGTGGSGFRSFVRTIADMQRAVQANTKAIANIQEMTQKQLRPEAPLRCSKLSTQDARSHTHALLHPIFVCAVIVAGRPD